MTLNIVVSSSSPSHGIALDFCIYFQFESICVDDFIDSEIVHVQFMCLAFKA